MLKKILFLCAVAVFYSTNIYAQDSKGFYRVGIGYVDFEHSSNISDSAYQGHEHYHEAGITGNFAIGYGTDWVRVLGFLDPSIIDGIRGFSVISTGVKGEIGVPKLRWLKLGGGVAYSYNHAKLSDDVTLYERADLDTVFSPFWSISFLPRSQGQARFFTDIRIGKAIGGDVIQPQTGKLVADSYVSVSLGVHIKLR